MRPQPQGAECAGGSGGARGGIGASGQSRLAQRTSGKMGRSRDMNEPQLQMQHEEVAPGVVVITLAGKLMLGRDGEQVEQLVSDLLGRGSRGIIFDIAGLTRVDSTGIGR